MLFYRRVIEEMEHIPFTRNGIKKDKYHATCLMRTLDQTIQTKIIEISTFQTSLYEQLLNAKDFKLRDVSYTKKYGYQLKHNTTVCIIV